MNTRSTRWLVAAALGLFAYIFFFERGSPSLDPGASPDRARLLRVQPGAVTALEVTFPTNALIRVERGTNGAWWMMLPDRYPAQSETINTLLERLSQLDILTSIPAREIITKPGGLAAFGLEQPPIRLALFEGDRRVEWRLGGASPLGQRLYVQQVGSDSVAVVDSALRKWMPGHADEWKDRSLVSFDRNRLDRIEARSEGSFYELQRDPTNRTWRLSKPFVARANSLRVDALVQLMADSRVAGFTHGMTSIDLESPNQQPLPLDLIFAQGTNALGGLRFGGSPTNRPDLVFASAAGGTNVVLVPRELADQFRPPHTRFRETRLSPFDAGGATALEVRSAETFSARRGPQGSWTVEGSTSFPGDPILIRAALDTLATLEVTEFVQEVVGDFGQFGLGSNHVQYTVRGNGGSTTLAQIQLGVTNQVSGRFARRTDEPSLYSIRQSDANQLPQWAYELRDRSLWKFATNAVIQATISYQGQQRRISRGPDGNWAAWPANAQVVAPLWEECLFRLGNLQALTWIPGGNEVRNRLGFAEVAHQLTVEVRLGDKTQSHTLNFGHLSPWNTPFATTMLEGEARAFGIPNSFYDLYEQILRDLKLLGAGSNGPGTKP
ncbi:MAG: DUF4340 domain-containing protein [Verrucomicrobia bacterium]|nr:DUF4340 domain-containing protein [Verrucomicrobiota bacterium]